MAATSSNTICFAMSDNRDKRKTDATTIGPRGEGKAYIARSDRGGKRYRYLYRFVEVDRCNSRVSLLLFLYTEPPTAGAATCHSMLRSLQWPMSISYGPAPPNFQEVHRGWSLCPYPPPFPGRLQHHSHQQSSSPERRAHATDMAPPNPATSTSISSIRPGGKFLLPCKARHRQ
jgi:hypothetical protein